jgi:hypothetical protein
MDRLISPKSLVGSNGFNSSLGTGEDMTFTVMYVKGKLHIDRKIFVSNLEILHE